MNVTEVLASYGIESNEVDVVTGPNLERHVLSVPCGTRLGSVLGLERELSMYLGSQVNIVAPIPGTKFIGVDVRRSKSDLIKFKPRSDGQIYLGKDVYGSDVVMNLRKAPHILVAGTTGSGKSVCLNSMICCELMSGSELYLLDPKRVEFKVYEGLRDVDVVCDVSGMCKVLVDVVNRMEYRYGILEKYGFRNIGEYNDNNDVDMSNIVVMVDEYADLLMEARESEYNVMSGDCRKIEGKRVASGYTRCSDLIEGSIVRLVQKARACGISVVLATQRPDAKVLTGIIRANVVSRIGLRVANSTESRVILGDCGCEKLAGRGDMIWKNERGDNLRLLGCWVSSDDIKNCRVRSGREC